MTGDTVAGLFRARCELARERVALQIGATRVCYGELGRWVAQVASELSAAGIGPGVRVGLALPRGVEAIVAMLAVAEVGGAFVPLPLDWPAARVEWVIDDARPEFVFGAGGEQGPTSVPQRPVPAFDPASDAELDRASSRCTSSSLLCILYTSGSTGRPKGVCLEHGAIVARLRWVWEYWPWGPDERSLQRSSLGFVDAINESLAPLLCGAGLVVLPQDDSTDVVAMLGLIRSEGLTRVTLVPALARAMLELGGEAFQLPPGSVWILSGERLERELLEGLRRAAPELTVLNLYGSTEVAGDATCAVFEPGRPLPAGPVPIGRVIAGAFVHLLDPEGEVVPPGVTGELCIGGPILARGYHRAEDERGRFVEFGVQGRLFRTGDRGRLRGGELYFEGRVDDQIKLRGVRIELQEVEAALAEVLAGEVAVVLATSPPRLVAFTTAAEVRAGEALAHAGRRLPPAAVPASLLVVDALPRTPSGKLDRSALRAGCADENFGGRNREVLHHGPLALEAVIARMMAASLGCSEVGRAHSLAVCGGDSLANAVLMARLGERFGSRSIDPGWLRVQTVAELAQWFDASASRPAPASPWVVDAFVATTAEREDLIALSAAVFAEREPLARLGQLRAQDLEPYTRAVVDQSLAEGLAWSAVDGNTGDRVGFCLAHDFTSAPSPAVSPAMAETLAVLGELSRRYRALRSPIAPGSIADISMTGALAHVDGLVVAAKLEREVIATAARRGFARVVTFCTHPVTAALAEQLGFVAHSRIRYATLEVGGEQIFATRASASAEAVIYELSLP